VTEAGEEAPDPLADAILAARLCAIDPGLGGLILRGGGEMRDTVVAVLRDTLPDGAPVRRIPAHIDDERLLGGIDLTATLALGRPVASVGLLAEADGGAIVIPMAERLSDATAGRIAAALDAGDSRFLVVALDDGIEPDERPPAALGERLAFRVSLTNHHPGPVPPSTVQQPQTARMDGTPENVRGDEEAAHVLIVTALALGIDSARATLFALRTARASSRHAGRDTIADEDIALAARLVLAPLATRVPMQADERQSEAPPPPAEADDGEDERAEPGPLEDIVLAAALAALPKDVLARIAAGRDRRTTRAQGAGARRKSPTRGRPLGARAGTPGGGKRLSLIDTLRAAAPWQRLRGRADRILVRRDDLRIRRFETRAEVVTIFAVDASGSSALARLSEAKGAVELLLAEAYVKRAQVALIAFRGTGAELLLSPTRSLARARRSLAELPGGGGTPLAAGLTAARELAELAQSRGRTPFIVILTDGRANIAADGSAVRTLAESDATNAAKAIGAAGIAAAFVDISARPRREGAVLAAAMGARYLPLPRADAATMHAAVRQAQHG
jgi:magnesium chelatase subunit D